MVGDGRQVVTNYHVVPQVIDYAKKERLVIFHGRGRRGRVRAARMVGSDPEHDLALLEIEGEPLPPLELGDSSRIREGEEIAFTGFPIGMVLGLYPVTHRGIVSVITPMVIPAMSSRQLTAEQIKRLRKPFDVLQLDATAYPGNSGSPVYDQRTGRVIGVVNSVFVKKGKESALSRPTGISYAIPVRYVRDLLSAGRKRSGSQ